MGDRWASLGGAVAGLPDVVAVSRVYETAPVGGPDQGPFLNCVVRLETDLGARALLDAAQECEHLASRQRGVRWGPRTLDVDVLWVDGQTVSEPDLEVPHPRMFERAFVLVPLGDVAPDLVGEVPDDQGAVLAVGSLDPVTGIRGD